MSIEARGKLSSPAESGIKKPYSPSIHFDNSTLYVRFDPTLQAQAQELTDDLVAQGFSQISIKQGEPASDLWKFIGKPSERAKMWSALAEGLTREAVLRPHTPEEKDLLIEGSRQFREMLVEKKNNFGWVGYPDNLDS